MTVKTEVKSFIETQFPVSKVSKESFKERKANVGQTLTGLGKWWGRKPLILVRAALMGLLMPSTGDPLKDREIFLKILTMDDEGLWRRKSKSISLKDIYAHVTPRERERWFSPESTPENPRYIKGITGVQKDELQYLVFSRLSYDEKLQYCDRPEQIDGPSKETWKEINTYLGTTALNLSELVQQLGERRFNHMPKLGDAFCGGGSIPFEGAKIGFETFGSDLNPVAALLTWASLNIIGGGPIIADEIEKCHREVFNKADNQISEWLIEHNEKGWRADAYLYCIETRCPECRWMIPLAPSWVIGEKTKSIAKLDEDPTNKRFNILILSGVSDKEIHDAKERSTIKNSVLHCPHCKQTTPINMLRGDRRDSGGTDYGLRMWENKDVIPRPDDTLQERLYCIRWVEEYLDTDGDRKIRRFYMAPHEKDLAREKKVHSLLMERFDDWQKKGYIPSMKIEPGDETSRLFRERGWTHWHHLFNPRQLLWLGLLMKEITNNEYSIKHNAGLLLWFGKIIERFCRLVAWHSAAANENTSHVFTNQALNTIYTYASLGSRGLSTTTLIPDSQEIISISKFNVCDCRQINNSVDIWFTDPPYADAINYHELSEFFLAWYEKELPNLFPDWYTDSKRALAITGDDEGFRKGMVECYSNLRKHMPDDGFQVVMFTHQNVSVWADLALILWASGLKVTAAWTIATETNSSFKEGNYVQGTVLLVLRKQMSDDTAFLDELYPLVEREVKMQLDSMLALDDKEDPNFSDTDYQLAAYAAALRVLTHYKTIEDINVSHELSRVRERGDESPIEKIIKNAVKVACNHLIPSGFDEFVWKTLSPEERFYLKGLDMESRREYRAGAYQELARGFGMREYQALLASGKANQTRLKTASEFASRTLTESGFGSSLIRNALFAIYETVRTEDALSGRNWLKNELKSYWNNRKSLIEIFKYLAGMGYKIPHWQKDSHAAELLSGALENDHI